MEDPLSLFLKIAITCQSHYQKYSSMYNSRHQAVNVSELQKAKIEGEDKTMLVEVDTVKSVTLSCTVLVCIVMNLFVSHF